MGIEDLFEQYGKSYSKGDILFNENDQGKEMFIILRGKIRIYKTYIEEDETFNATKESEREIAILERPEFLGEMSLLNNEPRVATAQAYEDSDLLVVNDTLFEKMIKSNGKFALKVISKLSERIRDADQRLEKLFVHDKQRKVINKLLDLENKFQNQIPRDSLNSLITTSNLTEEEIQLTIDKLLNQDCIVFNDNIIKIVDIPYLNRVKDFLES